MDRHAGDRMQQELMQMLAAREGHFRYESGYHSDLWLDLDLLFLHPAAVEPFAIALARQLTRHKLAGICGPLVGGALIAQTMAAELKIEFYYTERFVCTDHEGLYPVEYRLPVGLHEIVRGKRIAIVDDVISAGSAVRGTLATLRNYGIGSVVVGALLVLGDSAPNFFAEQQISIESVARRPSNLWLPSACPLCHAGMPLEDITAQ